MKLSDERLLDSRIVKRNIQRGSITQKAHDAFIKSLPDLAQKADVCEAVLPDAEVKAPGNTK